MPSTYGDIFGTVIERREWAGSYIDRVWDWYYADWPFEWQIWVWLALIHHPPERASQWCRGQCTLWERMLAPAMLLGTRLRLWPRDKGTSQSPEWFHPPQAQTSSWRLLNPACVSWVPNRSSQASLRKQNLCYLMNGSIHNDMLFEWIEMKILYRIRNYEIELNERKGIRNSG